MLSESSPRTDSRRLECVAIQRSAVFLDRDGTLIEDVDYLSDPSAIRFIPGAVEAVKRLRQNGFACVIVTNQSGVGRGMMSHDQVHNVHAEMLRMLREQGADLDGFYYCPVAPVVGSESLIEHTDRKPGPGMLMKAALELNLDLQSSWMVGDKLSDVLAGRNAGCRAGIRLRTGKGRDADRESAPYPEFAIVEDLAAAAALILAAD